MHYINLGDSTAKGEHSSNEFLKVSALVGRRKILKRSGGWPVDITQRTRALMGRFFAIVSTADVAYTVAVAHQVPAEIEDEGAAAAEAMHAGGIEWVVNVGNNENVQR